MTQTQQTDAALTTQTTRRQCEREIARARREGRRPPTYYVCALAAHNEQEAKRAAEDARRRANMERLRSRYQAHRTGHSQRKPRPSAPAPVAA